MGNKAGKAAKEPSSNASTAKRENLKILVASATANTGMHAIKALSDEGHTVIGLCKKGEEDERLQEIKELKGVAIRVGNFDDPSTYREHLDGIDRAILISAPFAYEMFEREVTFIKECDKAEIEGVIRISTASCLIQAGTEGAYGRAHHGIEAFTKGENPHRKSYKVVNLNPSWFLSNLNIFFGWDAKQNKSFSWPCEGTGPGKFAAIDAQDVGRCAAAVATCSDAHLERCIQQHKLEVHGTKEISWTTMAECLSQTLGYKVTYKAMKPEDWAKKMAGIFGMKQLYMDSLAETILILDGTIELKPPQCNVNSPILKEIGWEPKISVEDWAKSEAVLSAMRADDKLTE